MVLPDIVIRYEEVCDTSQPPSPKYRQPKASYRSDSLRQHSRGYRYHWVRSRAYTTASLSKRRHQTFSLANGSKYVRTFDLVIRILVERVCNRVVGLR